MPEESKLEPYPGFCTRTSLIQLGYGIWANLSTVAIGLAFSFPAIQTPQLKGPSSNFVVSMEEASWLASILTLFSPIGCLLSGVLMDKFGRSAMIMCCQLPMFLGWVYTVTSNTALHMIIARAVLGIGCGMAMGPSRLYTAEISLPNMRGLLGALPNMFLSLGMSIQAALGLFLSWTNLCYISGLFNVLLFSTFLFLTETPYFLILHDNTAKARKALTVFRAKDYKIEKEINDLIEFKSENHIRSLSCREKLEAMTKSSAYKPFAIIMVFVTCESLAGSPVVTFWTIEFLLALKSTFDVYEGNFYIALIRFIFCGIASALLFHVPRKTMALISAGGVCITCLLMAIFVFVESAPSVVPQLFLMIYTAFASLGFYILPFLFMSELYPLQIRGTLTGISISIINVEKFLTAKSFPLLRDDLGVPYTLILFSLSAFICFIFLYLFLPETKDLTLREIEEYFNDIRSTSASRQQLNILHSGLSYNQESRRNSYLKDMIRNSKPEKREFIEIYDSPSITSRESKKSVTLLIGGKQFKSMTSTEKLEMDKLRDDNYNISSSKSQTREKSDQSYEKSLPSSSFFQKDSNNASETVESAAVSKKDAPSTSKNAEQSNKEQEEKEQIDGEK